MSQNVIYVSVLKEAEAEYAKLQWLLELIIEAH